MQQISSRPVVSFINKLSLVDKKRTGSDKSEAKEENYAAKIRAQTGLVGAIYGNNAGLLLLL